MEKRITLISLLDKVSLNKINSLISGLNHKLCKVPYHDYVPDRIENDTLPFHITISAWGKEYEKRAIGLLEAIKFKKIKLLLDGVKIKKGINNSYVLYLSIKEDENLKLLHKQIYDILPSEKYKSGNFEFHITLHVDKDYEKIMKIKNQIELKFKSFEITFGKLGLFEIYPSKLIYMTEN